MFFSFRNVIQWRVFSYQICDRSSEHRKPVCSMTQCVALAAKQDYVVIGRIRAGEVTAGDVSHGSHSVDGLMWCNGRFVVWGVLIVCLFLFVSLAPCVEWCFLVCPGVFFFFFLLVSVSIPSLIICQASFCLLLIRLSCFLHHSFITPSLSVWLGEWCECN